MARLACDAIGFTLVAGYTGRTPIRLARSPLSVFANAAGFAKVVIKDERIGNPETGKLRVDCGHASCYARGQGRKLPNAGDRWIPFAPHKFFGNSSTSLRLVTPPHVFVRRAVEMRAGRVRAGEGFVLMTP